MELGKKIKKLRRAKKITQAELALMIGKSKSTIEKYERGVTSPPLPTLKAIAKILEVELPDLVESEKIESQIDFEQTGIEQMCMDLNIDYNRLNKQDQEKLKELYRTIKNITNREDELIESSSLHLYIKNTEQMEQVYSRYIENLKLKYEREIEFLEENLRIEQELRNKIQESLDKIFEANNKLINQNNEPL